LKRGRPPELDLEHELKLHAAVRRAIRSRLVRSAHDLAEGGLLVALAECAIGGKQLLGAQIDLKPARTRLDALLFGESQGRALLTCPADQTELLVDQLKTDGVTTLVIGTVGGARLRVRVHGDPAEEFSWEVASLHSLWDRALDGYLR
jgi:phosphoribosylformylglycinamidine synthase